VGCGGVPEAVVLLVEDWLVERDRVGEPVPLGLQDGLGLTQAPPVFEVDMEAVLLELGVVVAL
jgi:hypothetical protein